MVDYEAVIAEMLKQAYGQVARERDNLEKSLEQYGDHTPVHMIGYFSDRMVQAYTEIQTLQKVLRRGEEIDGDRKED